MDDFIIISRLNSVNITWKQIDRQNIHTKITGIIARYNALHQSNIEYGGSKRKNPVYKLLRDSKLQHLQ